VIERLLAVGTGELEEHVNKMRKVRVDDIAHKVEENARKYISAVEGMYQKSAGTIYAYLYAPIIYGDVARGQAAGTASMDAHCCLSLDCGHIDSSNAREAI
jgi:hypothetical protein